MNNTNTNNREDSDYVLLDSMESHQGNKKHPIVREHRYSQNSNTSCLDYEKLAGLDRHNSWYLESSPLRYDTLFWNWISFMQ